MSRQHQTNTKTESKLAATSTRSRLLQSSWGDRDSSQPFQPAAAPPILHEALNLPVHSPSNLMIQPKLKIGAIGDKYEQEADRVAAQVVNQINAPQTSHQGEILQGHETDEEDDKLQMKPSQTPSGGIPATPELEAEIGRSRSGGQPLDISIRSPMERAFGADFSGVRVHADAQADQLNRSIQAKAFTTGQNVFFRQGAYHPESRVGQALIAHELTHVVQQNGGSVLRASPQFREAYQQNSAIGNRLERQEIVNLQSKGDMVQDHLLQRAFGMEKESKIAVTTEAGETIENYPTIGEHTLYKVDIDKSDGQSILEVVTKHFNEHEGTQEEAMRKIEERLIEAWNFLKEAKEVKEGTLLDTVANGHALTLKDAYKGLVIKPGGKIAGPVHFTVGFSLNAIPELHDALKEEVARKSTSSGLTKKALQRVDQAHEVGRFAFNHKLVRSDDVEPIKIAAFMELLYTQISALLDGTKDDEPGLTKNRTLALSRVSMGVIRRSLSDGEQRVVKDPEFYEAVLGVMQKTYSGIEGRWGEHKRDTELFAALAQKMLKAAFNVDKVEDNSPAAEQGGFGKMTEVPSAEDVGDPKTPRKGFALELRKVTVDKNWELKSVMEAAFRVIGLSRRLHKTPDP